MHWLGSAPCIQGQGQETGYFFGAKNLVRKTGQGIFSPRFWSGNRVRVFRQETGPETGFLDRVFPVINKLAEQVGMKQNVQIFSCIFEIRKSSDIAPKK